MRAPRAPRLAVLAVLALLCAAAPRAARADGRGEHPPTANPYANRPYADCEGGFCPAADAAAEAALYTAAAAGDAPEVMRLLGDARVNASRNIVPDAHGFVRVKDAVVWIAAKKGQLPVMKAVLDKGYDGDYEEGHVVDLAAANGDTAMLDLLLKKGFSIGSSALAYAAKNQNADMMKALLEAARNKAKGKPPDLKSAMQAACAAGNQTVLRVLVEAGAFDEIRHPVSGRRTVHDWQGDYVAEAVATGHPVVLELLFASGYTITWQNAQDLIKLASRVGVVDSLAHLLNQTTVKDDEDELEEAVDNALKVGAEEGRYEIVDHVLSSYPQQAKAPCPAALIKATMYGHNRVVARLQRACNVTASSAKLQAAGWLGALFNAARGGHGRVAKLLMADESAPALLSKIYESRKPKKDAPPVPPDPEKDPLAVAAARGHQEIVELLSPHGALCAPCAAVAAAGAGHKDVFGHLVLGPAKGLLEGDEHKIQDALRAAAAALEGGHWDLMGSLMAAHDTDKLGPYFLPAIAQQGKLGDLGKLMELIDDIGCSDAEYVFSQISSAMVSAALTGNAEMLLALEAVRGERAAALEAAGGGEGGGGDRSEL
ncbi:MAG: hypothetical protein J3K34DRAFT_76201 [Monoraphidium minutum]|nr:MAG: hypothetical protein J3K34DRAFT_76201 [Monoraphidium minutum]